MGILPSGFQGSAFAVGGPPHGSDGAAGGAAEVPHGSPVEDAPVVDAPQGSEGAADATGAEPPQGSVAGGGPPQGSAVGGAVKTSARSIREDCGKVTGEKNTRDNMRQSDDNHISIVFLSPFHIAP